MRVTGDRDYRTFKIWNAGVMDAAPPSIDHAVVGMALEGSGETAVLSVLMRDVGEHLIPPGDDPITFTQHEQFIDHLADLGATMWGWRDDLGLKSMRERLRFFAPETIAPELARDDTDPVIEYADQGWHRLAERRPHLHSCFETSTSRRSRLEAALATTPVTFLHGDWKLGNLGAHPDGRTILLDWAYPGSGPPCWDLAWILALNRARLPTSKESTIDAYRDALERHGVATHGLVRPPARPVPARHDCHDGLGEGARRRRRAGLVARPGRARQADGWIRCEPRTTRGRLLAGRRGWATGAAQVYQPLADALVARAPHALAGRLVLDACAGTGCGGTGAGRGRCPSRRNRPFRGHAAPRPARRPPAAVSDVCRLAIGTARSTT